MIIRDWSLITGRGVGGLQYGRGAGQVKLYPYEKGGGDRNSFSHVEGGGAQKVFEVVLTREIQVLAILMGGGGHLKFGAGVSKVLLSRGGRKRFWTPFGPIL